jgi:hypothetical protein
MEKEKSNAPPPGTYCRATPMVFSMWPWKRKLDKEKSKHAGLAQQNGFGPALFAEDAKVGTRQSTT